MRLREPGVVLIEAMAVKKYKPTQTPHMFQQGTEDGNSRAARISKTAEATIAHTRELLQHSRELIERTRTRATRMQATAERHEQLNDKLNHKPNNKRRALPFIAERD